MTSVSSAHRFIVSSVVAILTMIFIATFLWLNQLGVPEQVIAPEIRHSSQATPDKKTAFLMLIDESGGINGACNQARLGSVHVVDAGGTRYQIARFLHSILASLWEEVNEAERPQWSFMQYARVVSEPTEAPPSAPPLANDPCHTNHSYALRKAFEWLRQTSAQDLRLILITDGSFQGDESGNDSESKHQEAQDALGKALEDLGEIQMYVLILGRTQCYENNDCGLTDKDYRLRRDDLEWWKDTAPQLKPGQITILDEKQPFVKIEEIVHEWASDGHLYYNRGWWDVDEQGKIPIDISPQASELILNIISISADLQQGDVVLRDEQHREVITKERPIGNGLRLCTELKPQTQGCTQRKWTLELSDSGSSKELGQIFYYWWSDFPVPAILDLNAPSMIDPFDTPQLVVTATLSIPQEIAPFKASACYRVKFEACRIGSSDESAECGQNDIYIGESPFYPIDSASIFHTFPIAPPDCAPHSIKVVARIVTVDDTGKKWVGEIDRQITYVKVSYQPRILKDQIRCTPDRPQGAGCTRMRTPPTSDGVTVSIPIRYASEICNPGLRFKFQLERSDPPSDTIGCPTLDHLELMDLASPTPSEYIQVIAPTPDNETMTYHIRLLPGEATRRGLWECGYRKISIFQEYEETQKLVDEIDIEDKCTSGASSMDVTPIMIPASILFRGLINRVSTRGVSSCLRGVFLKCRLKTRSWSGTKGSAQCESR